MSLVFRRRFVTINSDLKVLRGGLVWIRRRYLGFELLEMDSQWIDLDTTIFDGDRDGEIRRNDARLARVGLSIDSDLSRLLAPSNNVVN